MTITIQVPDEFEPQLRVAFAGDLERAALEGLVAEGYRTGKLGVGEVTQVLGFSDRFEAEAWLGRRGLSWNYDAAELEADRGALAQTLGDAV